MHSVINDVSKFVKMSQISRFVSSISFLAVTRKVDITNLESPKPLSQQTIVRSVFHQYSRLSVEKTWWFCGYWLQCIEAYIVRNLYAATPVTLYGEKYKFMNSFIIYI